MMWEMSRCCQVFWQAVVFVSLIESVPFMLEVDFPAFQGEVMPVRRLLRICLLINIARKSKWYEQCSVKLELGGR